MFQKEGFKAVRKADPRIESWRSRVCFLGRRGRGREIGEARFSGDFPAAGGNQTSVDGAYGGQNLPHASAQRTDVFCVAPLGELGGVCADISRPPTIV